MKKTTTKPRAKAKGEKTIRVHVFACDWLSDLPCVGGLSQSRAKACREEMLKDGYRCTPVVAIDLPAPVEKKRGGK